MPCLQGERRQGKNELKQQDLFQFMEQKSHPKPPGGASPWSPFPQQGPCALSRAQGQVQLPSSEKSFPNSLWGQRSFSGL